MEVCDGNVYFGKFCHEQSRENPRNFIVARRSLNFSEMHNSEMESEKTSDFFIVVGWWNERIDLVVFIISVIVYAWSTSFAHVHTHKTIAFFQRFLLFYLFAILYLIFLYHEFLNLSTPLQLFIWNFAPFWICFDFETFTSNNNQKRYKNVYVYNRPKKKHNPIPCQKIESLLDKPLSLSRHNDLKFILKCVFINCFSWPFILLYNSLFLLPSYSFKYSTPHHRKCTRFAIVFRNCFFFIFRCFVVLCKHLSKNSYANCKIKVSRIQNTFV